MVWFKKLFLITITAGCKAVVSHNRLPEKRCNGITSTTALYFIGTGSAQQFGYIGVGVFLIKYIPAFF